MDKPAADARALACVAVLRHLAGAEVRMPADTHDHVRIVQVPQGGTLFEMGQVHPYLYVIRQGCVKTVYRQPDGNEWVQDFMAEGAFFGSVTALVAGGRCSYACEALEDSELERLDYAWIERTAQHDPLWRIALLHGWKDYATRKEWREHDLLTLSPQARYEAIVAKDPSLAARVPQKDLARYLGITPVSLSRIRRRLTGEMQG
ncbi:MAG: Crp/Fnr family transcriptional regulator [Aquabacterium sp.]